MEPPSLGQGFGELKYKPPKKRDPGSATRKDGSLKSQIGFLGPIQSNDGGVMTEFSTDMEVDNNKIEIPTLVSTLTEEEVEYMKGMKAGAGWNIQENPIEMNIINKARRHAMERLQSGKSPFFDDVLDGGINPKEASNTEEKNTELKLGNEAIDELTAAAHAAFTQVMDVKRDILSKRNGAALLSTILESPGKVKSTGENGVYALSEEGNQIVDDEGAPLVFPDLTDVVSGRIKSLLERMANAPKLEDRMKAMRVHVHKHKDDFDVTFDSEDNDDVSYGPPPQLKVDPAQQLLEDNIAKLQQTLDDERKKNERAREDMMQIEINMQRHAAAMSQPTHHAVHHSAPGHPTPETISGAPHPHYMQATMSATHQGHTVSGEELSHEKEVLAHEKQHEAYAAAHNPHVYHEAHPFGEQPKPIEHHVTGSHDKHGQYHSESYLAAHPHAHTTGVGAAPHVHPHGHGPHHYVTYDNNGHAVHHYAHDPHEQTKHHSLKKELDNTKDDYDRHKEEHKNKVEKYSSLLEEMNAKLIEVQDAAQSEYQKAIEEHQHEKKQLAEHHEKHVELHDLTIEDMQKAHELKESPGSQNASRIGK